ncbi:MAG TPA: long-chain fatty acid--CoA ligase [Spirochaetota bacterium]|nr:long-chain fatty acid--CoA ligase [Spirochaetota bacterium]
MEKTWFKSYAGGIPKNLDYEKITVSDALRKTAAEYPDKTALIFLDAKITYKKLNDMVNSFATALIDMGVKPGDKVAMLLPNMPQIVAASYGAWRAGAVVVMNNPLYTDHELEYQLNNSESTVLVTMDLLAPRMIALRPKTKVKKIIVAHIRDHLGFPKKQLLPIVAKDKHRDIPKTAEVYEWLDVIKKYPASDPKISVDFNSLANLQYTGGTTGVSKGVMLTHSNLSCNVQQIRAWFPDFGKGELIMAGILPFFHSFGLTTVMNFTIWMAGTDILIPRPEPLVILQAIQKYKINFYPAVPTIYVGLLNHPDIAKYDISSIKGCFSGAAPLPVEVIKEFEAKTGAQICEGYGLSETSPVATINPWGGKTKAGSIGLPVPDTELKIVDLDEGTKEMPAGEPGEVIIRGPQVTSGYYNMPDESAKTVRNGWLFTGDIGQMDEDGYFYIVDRKKDMIIAGGYNIYPRDIDEVLFEHPKIMEACAIGIPDTYRGETVKAFVVLKPGESMTSEDVIEYCKQKLAKYKVPTQVEFIETLPKSGVGKILRKELRAMELKKMGKAG